MATGNIKNNIYMALKRETLKVPTQVVGNHKSKNAIETYILTEYGFANRNL